MKKLLLILLLFPILGYSQVVDLVRYNSTTPTLVGSNITAGNMSVTGGILEMQNYAGFRMINNSGVSGFNSNSYFTFSITASAGHNVTLSQFQFTHIPINYNPYAKTVRLSYSTNASFASGVQSLPDATLVVNSNSHLVTLSFPPNTILPSGQTMYLRMYLLNGSDPWWQELRVRTYDNPSPITGAHGPTIRGTVNSNTLTAIDDNVSIAPNTPTAIDVLANDIPGPAPINSVVIASPPTNSAGTATVNLDKTIQFVPTTNFYGTSSFTYTIGNGISTSTATVNVTIVPPVPSGALCGTYYIGSVTQNTYSQFSTITAAVNHMNANGISCDVTFLLGDTNYTNATETFPITINSYTGNTLYTTTFKPFTGLNVTITNTIITHATNTAVFKLNGADRIIIDGSNNGSTSRNLTLYNNHPNNPKKSVVWIASVSNTNGATNNTIKNLTVKQFYKNDDPSIGIFSGGGNNLGDEATGPNTSNTIRNVLFDTVGYPVLVKGSSSFPTTDIRIQNNVIGGTTDANKPFNGIYIENAAGYEISGNTIIGLLKNTTDYNPVHSGILIEGTSSGSIFNNVIRDVFNRINNSYCAGIYINSGNTLVYNNMISNIRENDTNNNDYSFNVKGHGIYMNSGANNAFYFNTIHMNATVTGGRSSCIYIAAGSAVNLRNNILYNSQTNGTQYTLFSALSIAEHTTNYNNFASPNSSNIRVGTTAYTLASWKTASSKDGNSLAVTPVFMSSTNLHVNGANAANLGFLDSGTPIDGISTDIDSEARNVTHPDMGADEWGPKCNGTSTTWNGATWSTGAPTAVKTAIIAANLSTSANLTACQLIVNTGFTLTINSGHTVTVQNEITTTTTGLISVKNGGNLVQVDDISGAASSGTNVTIERITPVVKQYDFVYWSTPIKSAILNTVTDASGQYGNFNPMLGTEGDWVSLAGTAPMQPGTGYIIRVPGSLDWGNNPRQTAVFTGSPNSGKVYTTIYKNGAAGIYNLVGNPYPSSLDARAFIVANAANITGNLYFWTHNTAISGGNYSANDYAVYNLTGSVATTSGSTANGAPTGSIASAQAFFIEAKNNNVQLEFNNSMRKGGANTQFFRSPNIVNSENRDKNRFWVHIANTQGAYSETLLGYIEGATNGLDDLYDGKKLDGGNYVSLYSILDEEILVIQGRGLPFNDSDVISLGYNCTISGTFSIGMNEFDGLFADQDVFLFDKSNEQYTNLKNGSYSFTSATGTFNDRFELRFVQGTLGTNNPIANTNKIDVIRNANHLEITSSNEQLDSVMVFDMLGRNIYSKDKINQTTFSTRELGVHGQVVIVKVKTTNNAVITKKIIMN